MEGVIIYDRKMRRKNDLVVDGVERTYVDEFGLGSVVFRPG